MLLITYLEVLTLKGTLCVIKSIVWPSHRTVPNHCQQLRPVLIVLELAPLTPRNNRKDNNSTREI